MFSKLRTVCAALVVSAVLLCSIACSTTALITTLNAVVASADAAVSTLSAAGVIPAPDATLAVAYLQSVTTAASEAATELASSDSVAQKSATVSADFAAALLPNLTGMSPMVSATIKAVDAAVQAFKASLQPSGAAAAHAMASAPASKVSLTDRRQLAGIRVHADSVKARLAKLEK